MLNEKGIGFQTPFKRITIHWSTSPQIYEEATEAARELWVQGLQVTVTREDTGPYIEESILKAFPWQLGDARARGKWSFK